MSFIDRSIYLEEDYLFELIGSNIKKLLVFSIKKNHYQTLYGKCRQNSYETFLLAKAPPQTPPDKFLVFAREKIEESQQQKSLQQSHFLKAQTYYSSFLRYVDLTYFRKLSEALQLMNNNTDPSTLNQWFLLYQVHNYKPSIESLTKYELKSPVYGSKTLVIDKSLQKKKKIPTTVSNLFRLASHNFYFVNDSLEDEELNDMKLIISSNEKDIYGLTYKVKEETLCIPLNLILYEKPCETIIDDFIMERLYKTCYISFIGSYCTGIEIEENKVITARHLLPKHNQRLGTKMLIKKYPYKQNVYGVVTKIGLGSLDIMQIEIINEKRTKSPQKKKQQKLVKQVLTGNIEISQNKKADDFQRKLFRQNSSKSAINLQEKCSLGDDVVALGFGRISYNINIFDKFELVLPTVARGVVSKIIEIGNLNLFLKTDAKLFSGFSGCGIWKESLVGMAVFILKNKNTNSHHNRHNFSYTSEFINKLMSQKQKQFKVSFDHQIEQFDKIQTRDSLQLIDIPKAKL